MNLKEENRHLKKKLNDAKKMLKKLVKSASYDSPGSRDTIYSMESEISEWLKSL